MKIVKTVYTLIRHRLLQCLHCLPTFLFIGLSKRFFFVVTVFLSYILLNICIGFLKTELNYRELYPLAWEIWRLDSSFGITVFIRICQVISFHPCSQSYGHCPINIAGALRVLSATYIVCMLLLSCCFTALQHLFRSVRVLSVNLSALFLGKLPRQFTSS